LLFAFCFFVNNKYNSVIVGYGAVKFVTKMKLSSPSLLVTLPGGLQLTAWHPVCLQGSNGEASWMFPATIAAQAEQLKLGPSLAAYHPLDEVDSVFNLALEDDSETCKKWHGAMLNGVPTITLGHGIEGDAVATHAYFGTEGKFENTYAHTRGTPMTAF
jgi:hypothetical protein